MTPFTLRAFDQGMSYAIALEDDRSLTPFALARKIGVAPRDVTDRLPLVNLVVEARVRLAIGGFTVKQAAQIARLPPAQQVRRARRIADQPDGQKRIGAESAATPSAVLRQPVAVRALEEAGWFAAALEEDPSLTVCGLASKLGRSTGYVDLRLQLLRLVPEVSDHLAHGRLSIRGAVEVAKLPPREQLDSDHVRRADVRSSRAAARIATCGSALVVAAPRAGAALFDEAEQMAAALAMNPGMTKSALARKVGRTLSYVDQRLVLLDLLPELQDALREGRMSFDRARAVARLSIGKQRAAAKAMPRTAPKLAGPPLEEARQFADELAKNSKLTHNDLARKIGRSPKYVSTRLDLLDLLPELQDALREGRMTFDRARAVARLPIADQHAALTEISRKPPPAKPAPAPPAPPLLEEAQQFADELANDVRMSKSALARKVGRSLSYINQRLELLDLIPELQDALREGRMSFVRARAVARLPIAKQRVAATRVLSREPLDEAEQFADVLANDLGMTQAALATKIGRRATYVNSRLVLLDLIPELRDALRVGRIPFRRAREVARLSIAEQRAVAKAIPRKARKPAGPPLEEAEQFADELANDVRMSKSALARKVGRTLSYVDQRLVLLDLIPELQDALREGRMSLNSALVVARRPIVEQEKAAKRIGDSGRAGQM